MRMRSLLKILVLIQASCFGLRLKGSFDGGDFFAFLAKFGFQKTDLRDAPGTQGFVFGNVTLANVSKKTLEPNEKVILAVLDRGYFLEYYGNRSVSDKNAACRRMLAKVSTKAYDPNCFDEGPQDFLRSAPCPDGGICAEEDDPSNLVAGSQLTYRIMDTVQSRFWYISLVSCFRNKTTCEWQASKSSDVLNYDLWLVNGDPRDSNKNLFTYQYSCDNQSLFGLYLVLLAIYFALLTIQIYAYKRQNHPIARFLVTGLAVEVAALIAINGHNAVFAIDGVGLPWLGFIGDFIEIFSQSLFMLLLLLLAMGWAVTRRELRCRWLIIAVWTTYFILHSLLYVWKKTAVDVIDDVEEYETTPGVIILVLRVIVMVTFVASLRDTIRLEGDRDDRVGFFLHFGAASLVWFMYLPIAAFAAHRISALWRAKFLKCVSYSADTFAYAVIVHLLWPGRSEQYSLLAAPVDPASELEAEVHQPAKVIIGQEQQEERPKSPNSTRLVEIG